MNPLLYLVLRLLSSRRKAFGGNSKWRKPSSEWRNSFLDEAQPLALSVRRWGKQGL
jgi:hypothetical protein